MRVEQATTQLLENNQKTYWSVLLRNRLVFQLWLTPFFLYVTIDCCRHPFYMFILLLYCKLGITQYLWCKDVPILQFLKIHNDYTCTFFFFEYVFFNAISSAGCLILWKRRDLLIGCVRHVIGRYLVTGTGGHPFLFGSAKMEKRWEKGGIIGGSTK